MRYKRLLQRSGFVPALLLFAAGWLTAAASPMGYEDLRRLLRADFPEDVVLAIIEEEGAPHLSPQEWLALRSLGASDRLLLALLADEPAHRDTSEQESPPTP